MENANSIKYNLTEAFYDALMNKDSLKILPKLIDDMDENLGIKVDKLIENPIIKPFSLQASQFVDVVKNSKNYHYDKKLKIFRFKKKPDLNLILFPDFEFTEKDSIKKSISDKIKFLKDTLYLSCKLFGNKKNENQEENFNGDIEAKVISDLMQKNIEFDNFTYKLGRIQFNENLKQFQIIFDAELYSSQALQFFNELNALNYFENYIKSTDSENFTYKPSQAAETLKKRILREIPPVENQLSLSNQINFIKYILNNPVSFSSKDFIMSIDNENKKGNTSEQYERPKLNLMKMYKQDFDLVDLRFLMTRENYDNQRKKRNLSMGENRRLNSVHKTSINQTNTYKKAVEINEKRNSYAMLNNPNYKADARNSHSMNKNLSLVDYIDNLKQEYNFNKNDENFKNSNKKISANQKRSISKAVNSVSNSKYKNKFDLVEENYNTMNYGQKLTENSYLRRFSKGEKPQIVNTVTGQNTNIYTVNKFDNNNPNLKSSKHKLSNIMVPSEHRFSCNYIDHNVVSNSHKLSYKETKSYHKNTIDEQYNMEVAPEEIDTTNDYCKSKNIKVMYSSETMVNIFANLYANNKFAIPQVFTKGDKDYIFSEIGIPIPKKLEHLREKKFLNKQANDKNERKLSAYNNNPKYTMYQARPQGNNASGNYENSNSNYNKTNYTNNKNSFYNHKDSNYNNSTTTDKSNNFYTNSNQARKSRLNTSTYEYNNSNFVKSKFLQLN